MDTWLIIVLVALGVLLLVALVLYLTGKKDLAKKLVLPFVLLFGAIAAFLKFFGGGESAIREENERIKRELAALKQERDALRKEIDEKTQAFEQKRAALQSQIDQNDRQTATLKQEVETLKAQGAEAWFKSLPADQQKAILKQADLPDLPDEFLNPSAG